MSDGAPKFLDPQNLVHRDDLPQEVIEHLEKITGYKVVCAGDHANDPEYMKKIQEAIAIQERRAAESFMNGTCLDCGVKMPGYPDTQAGPDAFTDDWQPAPGWCWFGDDESGPIAWQCPECDAKEETVPGTNIVPMQIKLDKPQEPQDDDPRGPKTDE